MKVVRVGDSVSSSSNRGPSLPPPRASSPPLSSIDSRRLRPDDGLLVAAALRSDASNRDLRRGARVCVGEVMVCWRQRPFAQMIQTGTCKGRVRRWGGMNPQKTDTVATVATGTSRCNSACVCDWGGGLVATLRLHARHICSQRCIHARNATHPSILYCSPVPLRPLGLPLVPPQLDKAAVLPRH